MATLVQLSPPPYLSPMVDENGILTPGWSKWFQQIYSRLGEAQALSNVKIGQAVASALSSLPIGNINTTLYTSPTGQSTIIDSFTITNPSLTAQTVSVYLVPVSSSPSTSNQIAISTSISAGATTSIPGAINQVIGSGAHVVAIASGGALLAHISGRQVS